MSDMFRRYYESHGPQHMPCPSPEKNATEFARLKAVGLSDEDAWLLMALSACGSMATQGSNGGGRYSDFLKQLKARGFELYG